MYEPAHVHCLAPAPRCTHLAIWPERRFLQPLRPRQVLDTSLASQAAENTGEGGIYANTQVHQLPAMRWPPVLPPRRLAPRTMQP